METRHRQRALAVTLVAMSVCIHAVHAADAGKPLLAVVDFAVKGPVRERDAGGIVAGLFGSSLSEKYQVVERQQLEKVLEEQGFQMSASVDETTAVRIGKILGAGYIVLGKVSRMGKDVTVEARVVNVETGKWGERGYIVCGSLDDIPKKLPTLLSKMGLLRPTKRVISVSLRVNTSWIKLRRAQAGKGVSEDVVIHGDMIQRTLYISPDVSVSLSVTGDVNRIDVSRRVEVVKQTMRGHTNRVDGIE